MIADRLIQIDKAEALAVAGHGEKVYCLVPAGSNFGAWSNMQTSTLDELLGGCLFFAAESNLTGEPAAPPAAPRAASPEEITSYLIETSERCDEKRAREQEEKEKALYREFAGCMEPETLIADIADPPAPAEPAVSTEAATGHEKPLVTIKPPEVIKAALIADAPDTGGGEPQEPKPAADEPKPAKRERQRFTRVDPDEWTDDMLAVLGALRYDEHGRTNWSWTQLANFFETETVAAVQDALAIYAKRKDELAGLADAYELPMTPDGRKRFKSTPKKAV